MTPELKKKLEILINDALCTDGAHHKQWYLEQIAELLNIKTVEHEEGIAP
jgi:hypothetical protein